MSQQHFRIGAPIAGVVRNALLALAQPGFANVHADTLTFAYRVTRDFGFHTSQLECLVHPRVTGRGFDAYPVTLGVVRHRAEGQLLSITLSTADGVKRSDAILERSAFKPDYSRVLYRFPLQLRRLPLHVLSPERTAA